MACACFFALLAAGAPRIALIVLWLFTPLVKNAFESAIVVPLLGLIFLPFTTVVYVLVSPGGMMGFEWLLLIFAFLVDLGAYGSGIFSRKR
jgi:hypothetical protein